MTGTTGDLRLRPWLAPVLSGFGLLFCVVWAAAMVAFPIYKGLAAGYLPLAAGLGIGLLAVRSRAVARALVGLELLAARRYVCLLLAVALLLRLAAVFLVPPEPMMDDREFHRHAVGMLNGQGYGTPGYRAFFPPGMSLVLAAWYSVTTPAPLAGKVLHALVGCLVVWMTYTIARQALPEGPARAAGAIAAVVPTLVFYTATLGYETLLALILLAASHLTVRLARAPARRWPILAALGLLLGFGALVKPVCLLVPLVLGVACWALGTRIRLAAVWTTVVVVLVLLVVSPWTWRNYRVLGAFVLVSTNGGYTLHAANNPRATGLAVAADAVPGEYDEVSRDRLRFRAALSWIADNPVAWGRLAAAKVVYVWGTTSSIMSSVSADRLTPTSEALCKAGLNVAWAALFVLCLRASLQARPWSLPALVPLTLLLGYIFVVHLFYEAISRHHVPLVPFLAIIAAAGFGGPAPRRAGELPLP